MVHSVIAWDEANKLIGFGSTSPASVVGKPEVSIRLRPVCNVTLNITCDALKKSGLTDTFRCQAITESGHWIAFNASKSRRLDFLLPAGDYKLMIYGSTFLPMTYARMTVPENRSAYAAPEIAMEATGLLTLMGKPAPELAEVLGWKGGAVKLADLKGKVVLLEFWGHWCGPCIASMPVLFELHEKFSGKDLAIVGVHVDGDGEVDTVAKLDQKFAGFKKDVWKGKDLPFPVAITSGKRDETSGDRGGSAALYGVRSYPSTILIDRESKVAGHFHARDSKDAVVQMEKLLKDHKK